MTDTMIAVHAESCSGCRLCETFCAVFNQQVSNPDKSKIKVIRWEWDGIQFPVICRQCERPACALVCPVGALSKDEGTGAVKIDQNICICCRMCTIACTYGAISFDQREMKMKKCELCSDDPPCIRCCETEAIQLSEKVKA